jgi:pre-mRNA-processing factor 40
VMTRLVRPDPVQDKRYEIQQKTTFDEFLSVMKTDRRTASIDRDALFLIFERVCRFEYPSRLL